MLNYDIVVKLRIAVANVYWNKDDMVNLIYSTTKEWIGYERKQRFNKFELAQQVMQRLWDNGDFEAIIRLSKQVLSISDFSHFDGIEDGEKYKARAIEAIQVLRDVIINSYEDMKS